MWQKTLLGRFSRIEQKSWKRRATAYKDTATEKVLVKLYAFDFTKFDSLEGHEI